MVTYKACYSTALQSWYSSRGGTRVHAH